MTAKYHILSLCAVAPLVCAAQQTGKLPAVEEKMIYREVLYLGNPYAGSHNPTTIESQPFTVTGVDLGWKYADGNFRPIDAGNFNALFANVFGVRKLGRTTFQGEFSYINMSIKDKRWNNTLLLSEDNPFLHSDSLFSKFPTEFYHLAGGFGHRLNRCWRLGLNLDYTYGVTAAQKDPRVQTDAMRFRIEPGVEFIAHNVSFGVSGVAGFFSEDSGYSAVEYGNQHKYYFRHRGLGFEDNMSIYDKTGMAVSRHYKGNDYAGYFQFGIQGHGIDNLFEAGAGYAKEETEEGGAYYTFDAGDFQRMTYTFTDRLMIRGDRAAHNVTAGLKFTQGEGIWAVQTETTDLQLGTVYIVNDRKVNHREWRRQANVGYRFDLLREALPTFSADARVRYMNSDTRYYPEGYTQSYENLTACLDLTKHFNLGKNLLSVTLSGEYNANLDSQLKLVSGLLERYYQPRFEYLSADYFAVGGRVAFQLPVKIFGAVNCLGIFADGRYNSYQGDVTYYDQRTHFSAGVSMVF